MSPRSRPLLLVSAVAACGLGACADAPRAKPGRAAKTSCPTVEQVGEAAGFPVTFTQSIGSSPDIWMACQYELTGRYRGTFIVMTGEPAPKADSVFHEIDVRVKQVNGQDASADRLNLGEGGWAFGGDSHGEAAAVVGSHVYHVEFGHSGLGSLGDQKDAMVRVLEVFAR